MFGGALLFGYYTVFTKPGVSYRCGFFGPAERILLAEGHRIELVPGGFRQFAPILSPIRAADHGGPGRAARRHGRVNLSLHFGATRDELFRAGTRPRPRAHRRGQSPPAPDRSLPPEFDNTFPVDLIDVIVEADGEPYALDDPVPTEEDAAIAANALAVRDRRMHAADRHRGGAEHRGHQPGRGSGRRISACTPRCSPPASCASTRRARSPTRPRACSTGCRSRPSPSGPGPLPVARRQPRGGVPAASTSVNDPTVIGRNHKLVSINGAMCVDLYGQVVADNIDGRQISGVGGHEDFVAGADLHVDAHSLDLPAVHGHGGRRRALADPPLPARRGRWSRRPGITPGSSSPSTGPPSSPGSLSASGRPRLADIAHPDFRDELHAVARTLGRE